jgi:hypothetical protein
VLFDAAMKFTAGVVLFDAAMKLPAYTLAEGIAFARDAGESVTGAAERLSAPDCARLRGDCEVRSLVV